MTILEELAFMQWLKENGYKRVTPIGDGRWVALNQLAFHWSMLIGRIGDRMGYDDRYCYADYEKAVEGLDGWIANKFQGEPSGWHRHPLTGRRIAQDGTEYIAD